jgi:S-adenosylmethionine hydrolase
MTADAPTPRHRTISFLSDYGRVDEFVGVVHSVIRSIAPAVTVIDITHDVPPFDVRAGGLALARSVQYLCSGVVLAVVDPGVGTARRPVAVELGDGSVMVGPDNGLLAPAVALAGGAERAVVLGSQRHRLAAPGATFDGRDVFAPAAAHLCNGVPLEDLGPEVDPASLMPGTMPVAREEAGALVAEVLWVDHYGNAQLNVDPDHLAALVPSGPVEVEAHGRRSTAMPAAAFAEVPPGGIGLVTDSYGLVALAADRAAASEVLAVAAGDQVTLRAASGPEGPAAAAVPVTLGRSSAAGGPATGDGGGWPGGGAPGVDPTAGGAAGGGAAEVGP